MNKKIISIDITPLTNETLNTYGGVMWEHNATMLEFVISPEFVGDYRYYIEYRSLMGTKVRTEYLEFNAEKSIVTYDIPITMSSLKGVECYFNIVQIDEDGNTVQVIKPKKFCLTFDYSPDTDNSLCKVNDFSVNALLEAIRLGTFKGDKGEKGDKGDKGETGGISEEYATNTFANAIKGSASGSIVAINDISPVEHAVNIRIVSDDTGNTDLTAVKIKTCGKNLFNGELIKGYYDSTEFALSMPNSPIFRSFQRFFPKGVYTISFGVPVNIVRRVWAENFTQVGDHNITSFSFTLEEDGFYGVSFRRNDGDSWDDTTFIQVETGSVATDYEEYKYAEYAVDEQGVAECVKSIYPNMTVFADTGNLVVNVEYNKDTNKVIEKLTNAIVLLGGSL